MTSLLFALCMGIVPVEGWGASTCTVTGATVENNVLVRWLTPFTFPTFNPNNYVVGQQIGSQITVSTTDAGSWSCASSYAQHKGATGLPTSLGSYSGSVYPTGIPGIGMVMELGARIPFTAALPQANVSMYGEQTVRITLVKTGDITAGGALTGEIIKTFMDNGETQVVSYRFGSPSVISPNVPTCTVDTDSQSLTVPMGSVSAGAFPPAIGSNAGTKKNFKIHLSCTGGATGTLTNAYITLTDQNNPGSTSDVLSLTPGPTAASGVGLNIFHDGTSNKITLGTATHAGTVNQAPNTTPLLISLDAQYVRTGSTITAGTANAAATFTISYQ